MTLPNGVDVDFADVGDMVSAPAMSMSPTIFVPLNCLIPKEESPCTFRVDPNARSIATGEVAPAGTSPVERAAVDVAGHPLYENAGLGGPVPVRSTTPVLSNSPV